MARYVDAYTIGAGDNRVNGARPASDIGRLVGLWLSCGLHQVPDEGHLLVADDDDEVSVGVGRTRVDDLGADAAQVDIGHQRDGMVDPEIRAVSQSGLMHPGLSPVNPRESAAVVIMMVGDDDPINRTT